MNSNNKLISVKGRERPLSKKQKQAFLSLPKSAFDFSLFRDNNYLKKNKIFLEIGFGSGEIIFNEAKKNGADILVLDDALQSFNVFKDISIYIYDGIQSFGNKPLVPAGPLREGIKRVIERSQIFFLINATSCDELDEKNTKHILKYKISVSPEIIEKKLLAFSGLGFNKKFLDQLESENLNVVQFKDFPDHHNYTVEDIFQLLDEANKKDAYLVTTEKDHIRIPKEFKSSVGIIYGKITSEDPGKLITEIEKYIERN